LAQQNQISRDWTKQTNLAIESVAALVVFLGILGVAAIPTVLIRDINITVGEFALYNLVFIVALLFCSLPAGVLAHKFGGEKVVSISLVIIALSDLAFGSSTSFQEQLVIRVILGVGACSWWISAPENLVFTFGKKKAALPLSIWLCGYSAGAALSYPTMVLGATTIGWRLTYQIFGIGCLILAILYVFAVKIPKPAQKIPVNTEPKTEPNKVSSFSLLSLIPHGRSTILLSVSIFFQYLTWVGVLTFFSALSRR
jgi:MFS family permease